LQELVELATDPDEKALAVEMADSIRNYEPNEAIFGSPRAAQGKWASAVRMINPTTLTTLCNYELPEGEAAFSLAIVQFKNQPNSFFVLVGCAVNMILRPKKHSGG